MKGDSYFRPGICTTSGHESHANPLWGRSVAGDFKLRLSLRGGLIASRRWCIDTRSEAVNGPETRDFCGRWATVLR